MKNRLFIIISSLLFCCTAMMSQNKIDALVEQCSTVGYTKFTSVVERDPETRKVKKVVKMLTIPYNDVPTFKSAFEKEKHTGQYIVTNECNINSHMLITMTKQRIRIYMLEYERYKSGNVTIIINNKEQ